MNPEITRYFDDLSTNAGLQDRMQQMAQAPVAYSEFASQDQSYAKIVAFANTEGYQFTTEDLQQFSSEAQDRMFSGTETNAAGCRYSHDPPPPTPMPPDFPPWMDTNAKCSVGGYIACNHGDHKCACFFGGGGAKDSYKVFLLCVVTGYLIK